MTKRELIDWCLTLPGAWEDYPFGEEWAVLRHRGNRKSFAMFYMREDDSFVNLKCEPMRADFLRSAFAGVTPGYHMNKTHWNTVALDSDVPWDELCDMVRHSWELTRPPARKRADQKISAAPQGRTTE